ncbi:MAG: site-specific integrase [Tannerellaceae bacterium]|jgi:site-specific recombinase XerD|nr:site-specific integrase [Tannerellaceae bacterium]
MKSTFRTLFYLRKERVNAQGLMPIMIRITINGQATQFNSKLEGDPKLWDTKLGRATGRTADAMNLNRILDGIRTKIDQYYNAELDAKGYALPETIKNKLQGKDPDRKSLMEFFEMHNEQYKLRIGNRTSETTSKRYELTKNRMSEFLRIKFNVSDVFVQEINYMFLEHFYSYLCNHCGCSNNTAMKFMQRFRTVFNFIVNTGYDMKVDPFANFRFHTQKVNREILSQEEIDKIYQKKFSTERLNQVRDIFIFQTYTGLAYIDVYNLTENEIRLAYDDQLWIMTEREKTGEPVNVPLLEIPLAILDKYKKTREKNNGKLLPVSTNQKMNEYLKEIATICGIKKKLSTHVARHTFATTIALANGVPLESVSKMLGHRSIKTTQIYAKVLDKKVSEDMGNLAKKLNDKKSVRKNPNK